MDDHKLIDVFAQLQSVLCSGEDFQHYMEYFERTFKLSTITEVVQNTASCSVTLKWKKPRYSIECWNLLQRFLANDASTTIFFKKGGIDTFHVLSTYRTPNIYELLSKEKSPELKRL